MATLTAAVQGTRVLLALTWAGIQTATIQRLDPDGVLRNVRTGAVDDSLVCLGSAAVFDHEAPMDRPVTYQATSPQATGIVVSDTFTRTVSSSWGTADTGQAWTMIGTASEFSVTGTEGRHNTGVANTADVSLLSLSHTDVDFKVLIDCVSLSGFPVTSPARTLVHLRDDNTANRYRFEFVLQTNQTVRLELNKTVAGTGSALTSVNTGVPYGGQKFWFRCQVVGLILRCKFWNTTTAEPNVWNLIYGDSGATVASGTFVRFASQLDSGFTGTLPYPRVYDNLTVASLVPLTVTASSVTVPSGGLAWLTHPGHPQHAGVATVTRDGLTEARPARRGVFSPIGTSLPVVVNDVRSGSSGTLVVQTNSAADVTRLRNMLADGAPLLLRQPLTWGGDSWWLSIGDVNIDRFTQIATDQWRRWTLPYQRIDRPSGASDGAVGVTYNDLKNAGYANYNALAATGFTYTRLSQAVT